MAQQQTQTVVGLGEALFDVFPDRRVLGGAPLNVAVQSHQLLEGRGGCGLPVSRIGDDDLGRQILEELAQRGIGTEGVQVDPEAPTGTVVVQFHDGEPQYDIVRDVAWDRMQLDEQRLEIARRCDAVCFGSLAQRSPSSRTMIRGFLEAAERAVRMFDVNLRQQYYDQSLLDASCRLATIVKLNEKELPTVSELLRLDSSRPAEDLRQRYSLDALVLTQGSKGTGMLTPEGWVTAEVPAFERAPDADSVGAGDACSAGVLVGMQLQWPPQQVVELANLMGSFVATRPGATPRLPERILRKVAD